MAATGKAPQSPQELQQKILSMVKDQNASAGFSVASEAEPQVGGQQVSPTSGPTLPLMPGAPARPQGPDDDEPARPTYGYQQPTPEATPAAVPGPVYPGQPSAAATVEQELSEARERLGRMEQQMALDRKRQEQSAFDARLAALPEDQRAEARIERERMLRMEAEIRLVNRELEQTHPLFTQAMSAIALDADVEIDPDQYRTMAANLEPKLQAIVAQQVAAEKARLQQTVQQQWGVRSTPEQALPTPQDHPVIAAYKQARDDVRKRPQDPDVMRRLIKAGEALRRAGLDTSMVK